MNNKATSAQPIKGVLALRRITIRELSRAVKVNPNTLGRIINGSVEPWPALRRRCAEHLEIPEVELFRGSES